MAGEVLKKITTRAKQLKKTHPKTKWTDLVKKAAKEIKAKTPVKKAATKKAAPKKTAVKKVVHKIAAVKKTAVKKVQHTKPKKMATANKKPAHVAGVTRKKHRKMSGLSRHKGELMHNIFKLIGSGMGGMVSSAAQRKLPGNNYAKGGIGIAAALGGMHMFKEQKHPFINGLFVGIGTGGVVTIGHATGAMAGIDDAIAGIFDNINGHTIETYIPQETAGNNYIEGHSDYMAATSSDIDKWILEGIPPVGGDEWPQ